MSEEEFINVLKNNQGIIFKVANSYCSNVDDRNDLVQEITVQIWKSYKNYDSKYKISTWIYRISLNVAISFYRKHYKNNKNTSLEGKDYYFTDESNDNSESIKELYHFISELNEFNKALILLYLDDYSYEEIAITMGITKTNVSTKISRIKKLLKNKFEQKS